MPTHELATDAELRARIDKHAGWHDTIEVAPGVLTPGAVDLHPALHWYPWPNVRRKRCLDVGTLDGFHAFEMERQGAREVLAIDVVEDAREALPSHDSNRGAGFQLAAEIIGSKAEWRSMSVYDLDPSQIGTFDVVVCGGLLRHLRDPLGALEAMRSVCDGVLLSVEAIDLWLSVFGRGRPLLTLTGTGGDGSWFKANGTGHKQLLQAAGFAIERQSRPFVVPVSRPSSAGPTTSERIHDLATRLVTGDSRPGVLHRALLARSEE